MWPFNNNPNQLYLPSADGSQIWPIPMTRNDSMMPLLLLLLLLGNGLTGTGTGTGTGVGPAGPQGLTGPQGIPGVAGGIMEYGHFFSLKPPDNAATIGVGNAVLFPQNGEAFGGIVRDGASLSQFILPSVGVYEVSWQVSVTEPGQLILGLDSGAGVVEQDATVAGRATGTSQISNSVLIATTVPGSILTVRNPSGNVTALTITTIAGGTHAVSSSLVIKRIA